MVNRDRLRAAALTRNVQIWIDQLQASYGEPACRKPAWLAAQALLSTGRPAAMRPKRRVGGGWPKLGAAWGTIWR